MEKKIKTYVARSSNDRFYICQAYCKKQMKAAGMNMKLDWYEVKGYDNAVNEARCEGVEITNETNVTNFSY